MFVQVEKKVVNSLVLFSIFYDSENMLSLISVKLVSTEVN